MGDTDREDVSHADADWLLANGWAEEDPEMPGALTFKEGWEAALTKHISSEGTHKS